MSYQVLARKWRPRSFETVVGQEHVLRTLINALDKQRLHHAYLFTGTRGVGKTSLARILAKCLNCIEGISAQPCGKCDACLAIDEGRFVDLIEVDAASRTRVEDTRELLNNVQYAPTRGRYKIYLIDEVHMLSGHSFNALLKTLEEPPEHVKFLLATTDPQKLPVTVLSRCLQFHLKNLLPESIAGYLQHILEAENISFEAEALMKIAKAAQGSMRDALSILDQAIAFGHGNIKSTDLDELLGIKGNDQVYDLLQAVAEKDGEKVLEISNALSEYGADFENILEECISVLHKIALAQIVPESAFATENIQTLSQLMTKEDVQLYYQIALTGRRDLPWASDAKSGFEMVLLRMLAFHLGDTTKKIDKPSPNVTTNVPDVQATVSPPLQAENWGDILDRLQLKGAVQELAANCVLKDMHGDEIELVLGASHAALLNDKLRKRLNEALNQLFNKASHLIIEVSEVPVETPAVKRQRAVAESHQVAVEAIESDPHVQAMIDKFGAKIEPSLIRAEEV